MISCTIDNAALTMDDIDMLQDFIVLATNDAMKKIDSEYETKLGQYSSMLNGLM